MLEHLTERELEVAALVADGLANRDIAEKLTVEVSTVESHVHHILTKLALRSRGELMLWVLHRVNNQ